MANARPLSDGDGVPGGRRSAAVVAGRARIPASPSRGHPRRGGRVVVRLVAPFHCAGSPASSSSCCPPWGCSRWRSPARGDSAHVGAGVVRLRATLRRGSGVWPFVLVTLGATMLGRLAVAIWGYPLWTFMPLAVLMWFNPVIGRPQLRSFARACLLVLGRDAGRLCGGRMARAVPARPAEGHAISRKAAGRHHHAAMARRHRDAPRPMWAGRISDLPEPASSPPTRSRSIRLIAPTCWSMAIPR